MDARLAEYVRGQWPALVRYAAVLCRDANEAEEVVQATLTRVALRWRFVQDRSNPDAYVRRALVRACIDSGKLRGRESSLGGPPDVADPDRSSQVHDSDLVRRALATLPPRRRAVLVLRHLEGASEAATAEQLGCSVGMVKRQTAHGLATLRAVVETSERRDELRPRTDIEERLRTALAIAPRPVTRITEPLADLDRRRGRLRVRRAAIATASVAVVAAVVVTLSLTWPGSADRVPAPQQVQPWPAHHRFDFASATAGGGYVWSMEGRVAITHGEKVQVDRRDPATGRVLQRYDVPTPEQFMSYGLGRLWIWGGGDGRYPGGAISVLDPTSGRLISANLGRRNGLVGFGVAGDSAITFGGQSAFGVRDNGGYVTAFDPADPADPLTAVAKLPGAVSVLSGQGTLVMRSHTGVIGQYPLAGGWPPPRPSEPITLRGYPLVAAPAGFWSLAGSGLVLQDINGKQIGATVVLPQPQAGSGSQISRSRVLDAAVDSAGGLYLALGLRTASPVTALRYYSASALSSSDPVPTAVTQARGFASLVADPAGGVVVSGSTIGHWDPAAG